MRRFLQLYFLIAIFVSGLVQPPPAHAIDGTDETTSQRETFSFPSDTTDSIVEPTRAPAPFDTLQLTWQVTGEPTNVSVTYSVSTGTAWEPWADVVHVEEFLLPDAPAGTQTSTLLPVISGAVRWRVRITTATGASARVTQLRVTTIHTSETRNPETFLPATSPRTLGARPPIVARTTWGDATVKSWDANGSAGKTVNATWMPTDTEIARPTHLIVHHTATPNSEADWPRRVRQIWGYHTLPTGNNWGDIGYHYLVDPNGVIYEGRYQGVRSDGTVIDGAHDYGFNRGTIGISMLGTYDTAEPTTAAQAALDNLIAYLMTTYRITPDTTSFYAHQGVMLNTIVGHRDAQVAGHSTGCPGTKLHDLLPGIRARARGNVGPAPRQTWLTGVTVADADVYTGDPVQFAMTVKNAYGDRSISGAAFTFLQSDTNYVYSETECWAKTDSSGRALFPKPAVASDRYARFRVMAGVVGWDTTHANTLRSCPTLRTEDHPWRWSIGATPLAPGATRTVRGQVRFARPGTYTVQFGLMKDWIGYPDAACADAPTYAACGLFAKTIVVRARVTPTPTTMPALATQLAASTQVAAAATATEQAVRAAATQTAIGAEFTATAIATSGAATSTATPTTTPSTTATPIPVQQTATRWALQTQTRVAERTAFATMLPGSPTPTRTRTATVASLLVPRTTLSTAATVSAIAPLGTALITLAPQTNRVTIYDGSTLAVQQRITFRGTTAQLLAVPEPTGDVFYVAGNYTGAYIAVQRFRIVAGSARETGYWIAPFAGTPTAILARGDTLTLAVSTAAGSTKLIRIRAGALLAEQSGRLNLPGPVRDLTDADGASGIVVATGRVGISGGYLTAAEYRTRPASVGTTLQTATALTGLCRRWALRAGQPVAQLLSIDDRMPRTYTLALSGTTVSGPTTTATASLLLRCPLTERGTIVSVAPAGGTVQVSVPSGTSLQLRATGLLARTTGKTITTFAVTNTQIWWSDGVTLRYARIHPLDYY